MVKQYKWRVLCTGGHGDYRYTWTDSSIAPGMCVDNDTHTINKTTDPPRVVDARNYGQTVLNEGSLTDTGSMAVDCIAFDIDSGINVVTEYTTTWTSKISLFCVKFVSEESWRGDTLNVVVAENTTVGTLATDVVAATAHSVQNHTAGDVVTYSGTTYTCHADTVSSELPTDATYWTKGFRLHVSTSVIANVNHGYTIQLTDGTNTDSMGKIHSIDNTNNYIYVENNPVVSNSYSSTSPTTSVQMTVHRIKPGFEFAAPWQHVYGQDKVGGSDIPENTPVKIYYTNVDGVSGKRFVASLEYLEGEHDGTTQ